MSLSRVLVSGSDGRIGQVTVAELQAHGYEVTAADLQRRAAWNTQIVDFTDLGQVIGVMQGQDAVVHLAAIPSPEAHTNELVFSNNVVSTFNVLEAATILGVKKLVLASSISALGYAYRHRYFHPQFVPIDESHPLLSQDSYGLSKMVGETLAEGFTRRNPDMSITSLRFTLVVDAAEREWLRPARDNPPDGAAAFGAFWTFVDARDAAAACRLALEYAQAGHEACFINAPSIYRREDIRDLLAEYFPGDYPIAKRIRGAASPVDTSKAQRMLGWSARYRWDGQLAAETGSSN